MKRNDHYVLSRCCNANTFPYGRDSHVRNKCSYCGEYCESYVVRERIDDKNQRGGESMKKAKALQDFFYGVYKVSKGDVLEQCTPGTWYYRVGTIVIPSRVVEHNPHIFECPYEEELTSDQWDEKARGYGYFIPRDRNEYYSPRTRYGDVLKHDWVGDYIDMALLRAGLAFETREEAEGLLEKLKKEKPL